MIKGKQITITEGGFLARFEKDRNSFLEEMLGIIKTERLGSLSKGCYVKNVNEIPYISHIRDSEYEIHTENLVWGIMEIGKNVVSFLTENAECVIVDPKYSGSYYFCWSIIHKGNICRSRFSFCKALSPELETFPLIKTDDGNYFISEGSNVKSVR